MACSLFFTGCTVVKIQNSLYFVLNTILFTENNICVVYDTQLNDIGSRVTVTECSRDVDRSVYRIK